MLKRKRLTTGSVASATVVVVSAMVGVPAMAATDDEVSAALLNLAVEELGLEISDGGLLGELTEDLNYVVEQGVANPEVVAEVEEALDSGEEPQVRNRLRENLESQRAGWADNSADAAEAFVDFRDDLEQCRAGDGASASSCAKSVGPMILARATEISVEKIDALRESLDGLTGDELEDAQARLAAAEEKLQEQKERLEKAAQTLSANGETQSSAVKDSLDKATKSLESSSEKRSSSAPAPEPIKQEVDPSKVVTPGKSNKKSGSNGSSQGNSGGRGGAEEKPSEPSEPESIEVEIGF